MDSIIAGAFVLLGFVVIPIWLIAGLADYFCHRVAHIEDNSGTRESVLHLVQFGLVGIPLCAGLFLQINAGLMLIMGAFAILHHVVAYIDVRYANSTRQVRPVEQMVHSFLELLPITALLLVMVAHFDQVESLFGYGSQLPHFSVQLRATPLPLPYVSVVVLGAVVCDLLPYLEELHRTPRTK